MAIRSPGAGLPATTQRPPPSLAARNAVSMTSGRPEASMERSTPRPSVIPRTARSGSRDAAFTIWVAPSVSAWRSFASMTSTAMIGAAPAMAATATADAPTPPTREPRQPFSGTLNVRFGSALHQRIAEAAEADGMSRNSWLIRAAEASLTETAQPRRVG